MIGIDPHEPAGSFPFYQLLLPHKYNIINSVNKTY